MKKAERQLRGESRKAQAERYRHQEVVMQTFIAECRRSMTDTEWDLYFTEAERHAGKTFHIVESLVYGLAQTRIEITPALRKSLDAVIEECDIVRQNWGELKNLNYTTYWRQQYGYNNLPEN